MTREKVRGRPPADGGGLEALRHTWFASVLESMGAAFWVYDPQLAQFIYADPLLQSMWEWETQWFPASLDGHPEEIDGAEDRIQRRFERHTIDAGVALSEYGLRRPDGSLFNAEVRFRRVHDVDAGRDLIVGITVDVTALREAQAAANRAWSQLEARVSARTADLERANAALYRAVASRKDAERELRTANARLQALLDHSFDMFWECDEDGRLLEINSRLTELLGFSRQDLIGTKVEALLADAADAPALGHSRTRTAQMQAVSGRTRLRTRDGRQRHIEWSSIPSSTRDGEFRTMTVSRDVTDRVAAEQRLVDVFDAAPDAGIVIDSRGRIAHFNRAAERLFGTGAANVIGEDVSRLEGPGLRPGEAGLLARILSEPGPSREVTGKRVRLRRIDGSEAPVEISVAPLSENDDLHCVAAIRDLTARQREEDEKRLLEAQLRQWQKLESLGALAGGVAHDFNNLLAAVINYANLALMRAGDDAPIRDDLDQIKVAARRMSELASQMLTYAGRGAAEVECVDLGEEIHQIRALLMASIPKTIRLRETFEPGLPASAVDPGQLRQIVVNLIANATEAIGENTGRIELRTGIIDGTNPALLEGMALFGELPASAVYLEVADSGEGMEPETVERMFEPFYSTRTAGRGLGLAMVFGIVRRHGGAIGVTSTPGKGSRVLVAFPEAARPPAETTVGTPPRAAIAGARILLVDDEESVRRSAARLLEACGARVVSCASGEAALRTLRAAESGFDAVLLDLTMPGMRGDDVLDEIRTMRRDLPVVLCTGYRSGTDALQPSLDPHLLVANKPYDIDEVLRWVQASRIAAS